MAIIRTARADEFALLPVLEARSDATYLQHPGMEEIVNGPSNTADMSAFGREPIVLLACDPEPLGFAVLTIVEDTVYIEQIAVVPEAQGRGLGGALLLAAKMEARTRGLSGVTLTTFLEVPWNAPFYARHGFSILPDSEIGPVLLSRATKDRTVWSGYGEQVVMGSFF